MGLYIARQIAQAHGGRIEVDSARGEGSKFRVVLPLNVSPTAAG
jgi:signal transduction histidine kinase